MTGVQTCALPICLIDRDVERDLPAGRVRSKSKRAAGIETAENDGNCNGDANDAVNQDRKSVV